MHNSLQPFASVRILGFKVKEFSSHCQLTIRRTCGFPPSGAALPPNQIRLLWRRLFERREFRRHGIWFGSNASPEGTRPGGNGFGHFCQNKSASLVLSLVEGSRGGATSQKYKMMNVGNEGCWVPLPKTRPE